MAREQLVDVDGRNVAVTNLDKVMYPATGTTKGDVIRYYSEIAPYLIPYAADRPITRKRWVNGVGTADKPGQVFFHKDLEDSAPSWVERRTLQHSDHENTYPILDAVTGRATLVWLAQLAALEIHVPQWRFTTDGERGNPDRLVLDLDPGEGAGLAECVEVAKLLKAILDDMGLTSVPVTSGSKGIHIYAALDQRHTSDEISTLAHELAKSLEADHPELVVSTIRKADRRGKVLVDWSQNSASKTTVAPYSLRGRERPNVAMPRTWREITSGRLRQIEMHEVMAILKRRGDAAEPIMPKGADRLARYRSMRDASKTPEPVPDRVGDRAGSADAPTFVVQEHHARRLHYDFRLERDGVLVSWAIPKGVPEVGARNHLAVHVEDHPIEYGSFQGEIPKGEYGAGTVRIWDSGTYETQKWRDDEVIVTLHGTADGGLGGEPAKVALIRTDRNADDWLIHRMALERAAAREDYRPMLAELGSLSRLPDADPDLATEMKWDGYRILATVRDGHTRLMSRNGVDLTEQYPELAGLHELVDDDAVLDGELVALDASGRPDFGLLHRRSKPGGPKGKPAPLRYMVFDILSLGGEDVTDLPYRERRELLEAHLTESKVVLLPRAYDGSPREALDRARELGLEGVIVKDQDSKYAVGRRSSAWRKYKINHTQEVVIAGWRPGRGRREGQVGSLLLGVPDEGGLRYVGRVGSGFDDAELDRLTAVLSRAERKTTPLVDVPSDVAREAHWTTPRLVGEIEYSERTADGRFRHPTWRGLRTDKSVDEVRFEI